MFNSKRLAVARKRKGYTKKYLAEKVGVTPQAIRDFERDVYQPSDDTINKIAEAVGFPIGFFFGDDLDEPTTDGVSFRAMSRMTARQRDKALSAGAIAFLLNDYLEEKFDLPEPDLLDLRTESPPIAAQYLRQHWGLGELTVRNMIHLLESKGVRVFSLAENSLQVDAFSFWRNGIPYIFLNTQKSSEHSRFDAAHELGHLVLHNHGPPSGQEAEKQANEFSASFLMPEGQIRSVQMAPSLNNLIALKKNWIVSVSALLVRLHRVGLISEWHYTRMAIEIQQKGYRTREPEEAPRETSKIWETVFKTLRNEGVVMAEIAQRLKVPPEEIEMLVFGLVTMGISPSRHPTSRGPRMRGHLRLVT